MLGGADNPNGELPSYITGADIVNRSLLPACFRHISCRHVFPSPHRIRERNSIFCSGNFVKQRYSI